VLLVLHVPGRDRTGAGRCLADVSPALSRSRDIGPGPRRVGPGQATGGQARPASSPAAVDAAQRPESSRPAAPALRPSVLARAGPGGRRKRRTRRAGSCRVAAAVGADTRNSRIQPAGAFVAPSNRHSAGVGSGPRGSRIEPSASPCDRERPGTCSSSCTSRDATAPGVRHARQPHRTVSVAVRPRAARDVLLVLHVPGRDRAACPVSVRAPGGPGGAWGRPPAPAPTARPGAGTGRAASPCGRRGRQDERPAGTGPGAATSSRCRSQKPGRGAGSWCGSGVGTKEVSGASRPRCSSSPCRGRL